jgi:hypothetical protein
MGRLVAIIGLAVITYSMVLSTESASAGLFYSSSAVYPETVKATGKNHIFTIEKAASFVDTRQLKGNWQKFKPSSK